LTVFIVVVVFAAVLVLLFYYTDNLVKFYILFGVIVIDH